MALSTVMQAFLLVCLMSLLCFLFSGCETAWGGSSQSSLNELNKKEQAKVDQMEQAGQLSSEEAKAQRQAINERTSAMEDSVETTQQTAPNPAGEKVVVPYQ